jgi:hypothetical protein
MLRVFRFGSKADIGARRRHVRFTPKADIASCKKDVIPLPATHAEITALRMLVRQL